MFRFSAALAVLGCVILCVSILLTASGYRETGKENPAANFVDLKPNLADLQSPNLTGSLGNSQLRPCLATEDDAEFARDICAFAREWGADERLTPSQLGDFPDQVRIREILEGSVDAQVLGEICHAIGLLKLRIFDREILSLRKRIGRPLRPEILIGMCEALFPESLGDASTKDQSPLQDISLLIKETFLAFLDESPASIEERPTRVPELLWEAARLISRANGTRGYCLAIELLGIEPGYLDLAVSAVVESKDPRAPDTIAVWIRAADTSTQRRHLIQCLSAMGAQLTFDLLRDIWECDSLAQDFVAGFASSPRDTFKDWFSTQLLKNPARPDLATLYWENLPRANRVDHLDVVSLQALKSPACEVRLAVMTYALEVLSPQESEPILRELEHDADPQVRAAASAKLSVYEGEGTTAERKR